MQRETERWNSPIVIALLSATFALVANVVVAWINASANRSLERYKARASLVVELVKTGNQEAAMKNLRFFVDKGLLDDPDGVLHRALDDKSTLPVLPTGAVQGSRQDDDPARAAPPWRR